MTTSPALLPQPSRPNRVGRDRLEILTALISSPSFDPLFGADVVRIPRDHPTYRWWCLVAACERVRSSGSDLCSVHMRAWGDANRGGVGKAAFLAAAQPLAASEWVEQAACQICPDRPAAHTRWRLCHRHLSQWKQRGVPDEAAFPGWVAVQRPYPGYGDCLVTVCPSLADSPLGLCCGHSTRYRKAASPGAADLPSAWFQRYEQTANPLRCPIRTGRHFCAGVPAPNPCRGRDR